MRHNATDAPAYDHLVDEITKKGQKVATAFIIQAPETLTTCFSKGKAFKKVAFTGGEDFAFSHVYLGKKQQFIFCFRPMSAQTYDQIEIDEAKVFETFGLAVDLFDGIHHFEGMENAAEPYSTFVAARKVMCRVFAMDAALAVQAKEQAEALEREAELVPYLEDPMFGMF